MLTSITHLAFYSALMVQQWAFGKNPSNKVAVWCSGNALVLVNVVALHRAQLVPTGMGDCLQVGKLSHYVTSHPGQLSLAIPPWVGAMSTGDGYGHC